MFRPGFSRLFLATAIALACAVAALVWLVLNWSERWTMEQIDNEIAAELRDLSSFYEQRRLLGLKELVEERSRWRPALGAVYLLAYRKSGDPMAGNVFRWPQEATFDQPFSFRHTDSGGQETGSTIRARAAVLNNAFTILVGRALEPRMALVNDFRFFLPLLAGVVAALGLLAAFILSNMLLRRLAAINATARAVELGQLDARAPGAGENDELGDLATHVNRMLDRINLLVEMTRTTSDRIAHELRTPLTRLRAHLQQAIPVAPPAVQDKLRDAVEETRKLSTIFDALLDISRIEDDSRDARNFTNLDLGEIIREVAEFYEPAAEERGLAMYVETDGAVPVEGDRVLLQRLIANLADNAIKFSPAGGAVRIALTLQHQMFCLTVRDTGPGMKPDFLEKAFDRFSRDCDNRVHDGFGLGLAIVYAIVRRHGFTIEPRNLEQGFAMVVTGPVRLHAQMSASPAT